MWQLIEVTNAPEPLLPHPKAPSTLLNDLHNQNLGVPELQSLREAVMSTYNYNLELGCGYKVKDWYEKFQLEMLI